MKDLISVFCKAGWCLEAAEVLAECFEYDHPAVRIKAEPQSEKNYECVERVQPEPDRKACW